MAVDARRVKELFGAALDIPEAAARDAYLDRECGNDAELRQRLDALLQAHESPASAVKQPLGGEGTVAYVSDGKATSGETPGMIIAGKYKLLQQIGEGGMGSVWMADQTEPVKRRVAVKLIRTERGSSKTILARFDAERQAIALMDHPNIAKLLDAGTTANSAPYFVMELVKGVPLTAFCDAHKLSIPDRLRLFMQICAAVQHAHQKGIIHRDLKPSNILVELHDDRPVPKVIDFGLAKATSGLQLTENTLFTGFGTVAGTPLYMAPEQANFNAMDIDTRADIYALGVILYELLTGTTPITREAIKKAALDEMMKLIREQEAPTPSSRLSTSEATPTIAANRHTEPLKLGRYVKGELDWIVMKALCKERDRRYETANGFARDIERFLNHEAVQAGPVSAGYRLKKFVKRNKGKALAAALVLVTLLAGIAGTTYGLVQARRQQQLALVEAEAREQARRQAVTERQRAEAAAVAERVANEQAQKRLTQVEKANDILGSIFENLDPREIARAERPLQAFLVEKLGQAVEQLEGEAIGDPLVVAAMQHKFGVSLLSLGEPGKAIVLLEKARATRQAGLGAEHLGTLQSMNILAWAYHESRKLDRAVQLFEETLKLYRIKLGPEHPSTLGCMNNLALTYQTAGKLDLALPLFEETLKLRTTKLGREHPSTVQSMGNLARGYEAVGKLDLALPLHEETLKLRTTMLGREHPDTLNTMSNLALTYKAAGKLDLALPLFEETLKLTKAKLGPEHPDTLASMNSLAVAYQGAGRQDLALPLHKETLKLRRAKLGPEHPSTFTSMDNLAGAYQEAGKLDLALPLFEETLKLRKAKLGPEHPDTLTSMSNLAHTYQAAGKLDLALPLSEETFKVRKVKLGPDHPHTLISMNNLAAAYRNARKLDLALPLSEETFKLTKAKLGTDHPLTLASMNNLAEAYRAVGKLDLALPILEETLKLRKAKLGPDHPDTLKSMSNLGSAYCDANQSEKAATTLKEFVASERKRAKPDDPQFAVLLAKAALDLLKCRQFTAAEEMLRECLAIREKTQPDAWNTFNTQSMLGGTLLGQKRYADAEPLLLAGYAGMKQREKTIPPQGSPRLPEAIDRLIELYTATNKPDEVKKWQVERGNYGASAPKPKLPAYWPSLLTIP